MGKQNVTIKQLVYRTLAAYSAMGEAEKKEATDTLKFKLATEDERIFTNHFRAAHIFLRIVKNQKL